MLVYLISLPVWNFILPTYAYWHFDDFSWGDTRQTAGAVKGADKAGHGDEGEFDSSQITMKRWVDFEQERRLRTTAGSYHQPGSGAASGGGYRSGSPTQVPSSYGGYGHERKGSGFVTEYQYP